MSDDKASLVKFTIDKCSQDKGCYNYYMNILFSQFKFINLKTNKLEENNDKLIDNVKQNINILIKHIDEIKENKEYKDLYQCLSCIFGAFLGDALGAYCEFKSPSLNNLNLIFKGNPMFGDSPGQVTDDSEMAMSSAFGIMDNPNILKLNSDYLYYYYGCWYLSHPRDVGFTTRRALSIFEITEFDPEKKNIYHDNYKKIKINNDNSLANGFLMRTSPFIVWVYYRFKKIIEETFNNLDNNQKLLELFQIIKIQARKDNICTHPNDSICIAHSCFCIMSLASICGYNAKRILEIEENLLKNKYFEKSQDAKSVKSMIMEEISQHKKDKEDSKNINSKLSQSERGFNYFTKSKKVNYKMGYYVHAFRLTLYYLSYFDEIEPDSKYTKYRIIMNQICTYGGDTDTNAAIVGAVIGPLIGYNNFGNEDFKKMVKLVPKKRFIFSPALMVLYVYFLKQSNNEGKIKNKMNFLRMLLKVSYEKIDLEILNEINSVNKNNDNNTDEEIEKEEKENKEVKEGKKQE